MKIKNIITWIFIAAFVVIPSTAHAESVISALWARQYVAPMATAGLIPESLKADKSYRDAITREEFAELMMAYLNTASPELNAFEEASAPFTDTRNAAVLEAYRLEIVAGVTPTEFEPNLPISRAEAATMLFRLEAVLTPQTPSNPSQRVFNDDGAIPAWARTAVVSMVASGAFSGYEDGTFRPHGQLTEEQGIKLLAVLADSRDLITLTSEAYPPIRFEFSKTTVTQGEVVELSIQNPLKGDVPFIRQTLHDAFRFYSSGTGFTGVVPTGYSTPPGTYWVEYGIQGFAPEVQIITILPRAFRIQNLTVSKAVESSTKTEEAIREFAKYFKPSRKVSSPEKYSTEPFILPASGRLSTEFGEMRRVNNALTSYRHSGLDIAAPLGTPIHAANRGRVALSMQLILTGNTIVIDHGQGLFSVYFHMNKRSVEKDAIVERNAVIGEMGTTGFSTGSHLHFTMSYYDTNIEPGYQLYGQPVTKGNYQGLFD